MPRTADPKTERLEIRITPGELEKLRREAERRNLKVSRLVRDQLGALLDPTEAQRRAARRKATETPAPPVPSAPEESVNLVTVLAGRLGMPKALVARAIGGGRVAVDGEAWTAVHLPKSKLGEVSFDGMPV